MLRIPYEEVQRTIKQAFIRAGVDEKRSDVMAQTHADASRDGIFSHGLNRVEIVCAFIKNGTVDITSEPSLLSSLGALEQYDGNRGLGVINGIFAIDRAMELADQYGIGAVGMANTSHWMRAGMYGLRATDRGFLAICWTTVEGCMPPWGGLDPTIGNNPFVMAAPGPDGPMLLDISMAQYSYGTLMNKRIEGKNLEYPGGFGENGELTCDPDQIIKTKRVLPIGMWKGAAFSMAIEFFSVLLAKGKPLSSIKGGDFSSQGCTQVYIAVSPKCFGPQEIEHLKQSIEFMKSSRPDGSTSVQYPGEGMMKKRAEALAKGVLVHEEVWDRVKKLAEKPL